MPSQKPTELSERQISQLLLRIYQVNGWPILEQQEAQKTDGRAPTPAKTESAPAAHKTA